MRIPSRLFHGRPKPNADEGSAQETELSEDDEKLVRQRKKNDADWNPLCFSFLWLDRDQPAPEPRFVKPPEFIPLQAEWIEEQIGLLQPIYKARFETKDFKLKDDDQVTRLPKIIRPKVPPSGKIPIKRRALQSSQSNNKTSEPSQNANKKVKLDTNPLTLPSDHPNPHTNSTIGPPTNHARNEDIIMK